MSNDEIILENAMVSLDQESVAGGLIEAPGVEGWTILGLTISKYNDHVRVHIPHPPNFMAEGTAWFTVDGIPVVTEGCHAQCGHVANGNDWMTMPLIPAVPLVQIE